MAESKSQRLVVAAVLSLAFGGAAHAQDFLNSNNWRRFAPGQNWNSGAPVIYNTQPNIYGQPQYGSTTTCN